MTQEMVVVGPEQQQAWIGLATWKNQVTDSLQKSELQIQGTLMGIEANQNLPDVQMAIKEAKRVAADAKALRLSFTNKITEKLFVPLMEPEKRNDVLIKAADAHELELRKAEAARVSLINQTATEEAQLKAHLQNEYVVTCNEYMMTLDSLVSRTYSDALTTGKLPDRVAFAEQMKQVKPSPLRRFNRVLVSTERATQIYNEVQPADYLAVLADAITRMEQKWAHFEHDVANAAAAIEAEKASMQEAARTVQENIAVTTATNTLMAAAEQTALPVGPKIKKKMVVKFRNDEGWAKAVMSHFLKNWVECGPLVRVKSWDKLTISQMAAALGEVASKTGEVFQGLELEEEIK